MTTSAAFKLDDLFETTASPTSDQNLPVRITGYDCTSSDPRRHLFHGISIVDGHPLRVQLRPDDEADKRTHPRPSVAWAQKKIKVGGVIRFDRLQPAGADGISTAWWPTVMSHDETEASVEVGLIKIRPIEEWADQTRHIMAEQLSPKRIVTVSSIAELDQQLGRLFEDRSMPGTQGAYVRVSLGTETKMVPPAGFIRTPGPAPLMPWTNSAGFLPTKESIEKCLAVKTRSDLSRALSHGASVEILPVRVFEFGKTTVAAFAKGTRLPDRPYRLSERSDGAGGFVPSSFNLIARGTGKGHYTTEIKPLTNDAVPIGIEAITSAAGEK